MRNLDFSSWQGVLSTLLGLAVITLLGVGIRLLDVPTVARDDPRAQQYIVDHLAPGAVVNRRIEVSNTTRDPLSVAIYPAAAHRAPSAGWTHASRSATPRRWRTAA